MSKRSFILPYRMGSRSTVALSRKLGCLIIRRANSNYVPLKGDRIINWGNSRDIETFDFLLNTAGGVLPENVEVLNPPSQVKFCANKVNFFNLQKAKGNEDIIPRSWTDKNCIPDDAYPRMFR